MSARRPPAISERAGYAWSGGWRGRLRWVTVTVVMVVAAGAGAVWLAGGFRAGGPSGSGSRGLSGTTTQTVRRGTLSAQTTLNATLGYAGSWTVTVPGSSSPGPPGTFTWLPRAGRVIRQGRVLYRTDNGVPACLL
jgi:hypothetical protein